VPTGTSCSRPASFRSRRSRFGTSRGATRWPATSTPAPTGGSDDASPQRTPRRSRRDPVPARRSPRQEGARVHRIPRSGRGDRRCARRPVYKRRDAPPRAGGAVPAIPRGAGHGGRRTRGNRCRRRRRRHPRRPRVGDEGIDLPNAELAIVASGLGGSRRQGSQRAGRTMRPTGSALVYVLATRGSSEEEFAQRQMRHLARKGIRVRETNVAE